MKNNTSILGFSSLNDWISTTFGAKCQKLNILLASAGGISGFISQYIYNDAKAIYFMAFLLLIDFLTGIWRAIRHKRFSSARLPRVFVNLVVYCLMLSIGTNLALFAPEYDFVAGTIYGGIVGTLSFSVYENLSELGFLRKSGLNKLK